MIKEGNRCVNTSDLRLVPPKACFLPTFEYKRRKFRGQRSTVQTMKGEESDSSDGGMKEVMQERRKDLDRQILHLLEIKKTE